MIYLGFFLLFFLFSFLFALITNKGNEKFKKKLNYDLSMLRPKMIEKEVIKLLGKPNKVFGIGSHKGYYYVHKRFVSSYVEGRSQVETSQIYEFTIVFKNGFIDRLLSGEDDSFLYSKYSLDDNLIRKY
jgi:hypothetical protein